MRNVPVGSETRARHIGWISVPTFSTSVITPTTKTRFTLAPSGVTTYDGARSPPPSISRVASLYSHAQVRLAFDLAVGPARAFPQDPSAFGAPVDKARAFPQVDQDPSHGDVGGAASLREILDPHARARVEHVRGWKQVRFEPGDRRALVEADLRDAPPRLDVGAFDPEDLFDLQVKVLPGAELGLAGLVGKDAGEDRFRIAVDLDLPPLDGKDSGRDRDVRGPLPQVHDADRGRFADVRLARSGLEFRERVVSFFADRRAHAEVHLDLAAVLLRVRVLDSEHIALGQGHWARPPRREGYGGSRITQDAGRDRLRFRPLGGHC